MNIHFYSLFLLLLVLNLSATAQTTLSGGELTGTLTKAGSPYTVTADLTVPKGKSIVIEPGVQMYFNQHIGMDVFGQITAQGTASDSIIFTAADTALGWYGIRILKTLAENEEQSFSYCRFSYHFLIKHSVLDNHGVLRLDTANMVSINNCLFTKNRSAWGSGIKAWASNISIEECIFSGNMAIDTNALLVDAIEGVTGSVAAFGGYCKVSVEKCIMDNNVSRSEYYDPLEREPKGGSAAFIAGSGIYKINKCTFSSNKSQRLSLFASYGQPNNIDSLILTNCTFYKNQIQDGALISLNGNSDDQYNAVITDCTFEENYGPDSANYTSTIQCYNSFGGLNEVTMERCTLLNNDNYTGIMLISSSRLYFNNGLILGQNGIGFSLRESVNCRILNSVIANNYAGVNADFNSQIGIINSTIAYNGNEPVWQYRSGSGFGLNYSDRGRIDLINSIVTHNIGSTGRMANITSTTRYYFPGYLHNSIVEGGTDSTYKFTGGSWDIEEGSTNFLSVKNLITKPISFVKPPLGVGRAYASLDNDFHVIQTCDSTPVYDQGDYFNPPYPLNSWNDIDKDGNPRIQGHQMDIGPYELSGEKFETELLVPWRDTTLCSNDLEVFNPIVLGADIIYRWQSSANNSSWTDLPASSFDQNKLLAPKASYYRLITEQTACNVVDTFGGTKLEILLAPNPNLGPDKNIGNNDSVWLTPGNFSSYKWNIYSKTKDTSHVQFDATVYPKNSKRIVWVEVTAANGCIARDSINIFLGTADITKVSKLPLALFPNPASSYVRIDLAVTQATSLVILNMSGQTVVSQDNLGSQTEVDIRDLPAGFYTIILSQGKEIYSARFVKE